MPEISGFREGRRFGARMKGGKMAGLNAVPSGERVHIGFFGLRNVGKSSLVNAVTGQDLAVVSDVRGTTTDPVQKAMELLPIGPVVVIDTPGIDDVGGLGEMRVERARRVLRKCDIAVLVTEAGRDLLPAEEELVSLFRSRGIPFVVAQNKCDIASACRPEQGGESRPLGHPGQSGEAHPPCHPERRREAPQSKDLSVGSTAAAKKILRLRTRNARPPLRGGSPRAMMLRSG